MSGLGWVAVILLCLGAGWIADGAATIWSDTADDDARRNGLATTGLGAALLFGGAGALLGWADT